MEDIVKEKLGLGFGVAFDCGWDIMSHLGKSVNHNKNYVKAIRHRLFHDEVH